MRRGQAALEFLTTYGWAFMVILVMIGAISYFGISNPSVFIPDRCQFAPDVTCADYVVLQESGAGGTGVLMIDMKQTLGRTTYLVDFECGDPDGLGSTISSAYHVGSDPLDVSVALPFANIESPPRDAYRQWDPAERITAKCFFNSPSIFEGRESDSVRIPVTVVIQKRDGGFNHTVEGEVIGKVQSFTP